MAFEGTFKIDRAIAEIETWPTKSEEEAAFKQEVLELLVDLRDTDGAKR
jgi:hypothetical protein